MQKSIWSRLYDRIRRRPQNKACVPAPDDPRAAFAARVNQSEAERLKDNPHYNPELEGVNCPNWLMGLLWGFDYVFLWVAALVAVVVAIGVVFFQAITGAV
ncbi:MAG: hypothetical protein AAGC95_09070 [Pseudomonadota bacterium]